MSGARINDPIQRMTRIRVMDYSLGIGGSEGQARSLGRGGRKRGKYRGG